MKSNQFLILVTQHTWAVLANDIETGLSVDSSGRAYVTGNTDGPNFPTFNGFQTTYESASTIPS